MNENLPLVSIGLPVFNGENYIAEAIDSVLKQNYANFELIISDNGSTDQTETICRSFALRDKRIHYHRNLENLGITNNHYMVYTLAKGVYFTWLAHDDLILSQEYISNMVKAMENENIVACNCYFKVFMAEDPNDFEIRKFEPIANEKQMADARLEFFRFPTQMDLMLYSFFRLDQLKKAISFIKDTKAFGYHFILAKLCYYGYFKIFPEVLRAYRSNLDSISYSGDRNSYAIVWLKSVITFLKMAITFPEKVSFKLKLIKITLLNFIFPFKNTLSTTNELKILRKEIKLLRKVCAERLNLIESISKEANDRLLIIHNLQNELKNPSLHLPQSAKNAD